MKERCTTKIPKTIYSFGKYSFMDGYLTQFGPPLGDGRGRGAD